MKCAPFLLPALAIACLELYSCTTTIHVSNEPPVAAAPAPANSSYQVFYDELSPYGHWINYPGYGYVWTPAVGQDFRPYATNGHWVYSDAGWTWVSDYPWGWAAFHYGRWFYDDAYGWMWVPGNEWSPAWVSWRRGTDMYGWAPIPPEGNASASFNRYDPPARYWNFVPHQYVTSPHVNNYYTTQERNEVIIKNTTVINNTTINNYNYGSGNAGNSNGNNNQHNNGGNGYNRNNRPVYAAGPAKSEVEQVTNTHIAPLTLHEGGRPGQEQANNGQLQVYRPGIASAPANANNKPAPAKVETLNQLPTRPAPMVHTQTVAAPATAAPPRRDSAQASSPQHPAFHPAPAPARPAATAQPTDAKPANTAGMQPPKEQLPKEQLQKDPAPKEQPANTNPPDKSISRPTVLHPLPPVARPSDNVKNTAPANAPAKTPETPKPAVATKPALTRQDSIKMNVHNRPMIDSLRRRNERPAAQN